MEVPFLEIFDVSPSEVSGQRFLNIKHRGGKLTLVASMLPTEEAFDEIYRAVDRGVRASRLHTRY